MRLCNSARGEVLVSLGRGEVRQDVRQDVRQEVRLCVTLGALAALFRHGVMGLRLEPEAFWRLSWREWQMLTAAAEQAVLSRQVLDDLMKEFPDE